jgi:hypothetical protein
MELYHWESQSAVETLYYMEFCLLRYNAV